MSGEPPVQGQLLHGRLGSGPVAKLLARGGHSLSSPLGDAAAGRRASAVSGRLWEPAVARRWGWCRGLPCHAEASWPDGRVPQRAVTTVTDRNPAPVTSPAPARSAPSLTMGRPRAGRPPGGGSWHAILRSAACRGDYGCVVGLAVGCGAGWEAGGPAGWEAGGPAGREAGGPAG